MTSPALLADYRLERAAQDARFDSRPGAGSVDHTMTGSEEYRAYFGLGEFHGYGVEQRVTFKSFLIARGVERRAEREAAEAARRAELVAAAPTHFLLALADDDAAAAAELDARLAEWDAAHDHEPVADLDAELAELVDAAAAVELVAAVAELVAEPVRVAACVTDAATSAHDERVYTLRKRMTSTNVVRMTHTTAAAPVAHVNREAWLTAAVAALRPIFGEAGVELPATVNVSCGFPGGKSIHKVIGQCWSTAASADGAAQVFVSPMLSDVVDVLAVLVHELIHAWDDCKSGHKGAFAKAAKRVGLTGKMTATVAGDELRERLAAIADELGAYPHAGMAAAMGTVKKQSTRMLKLECPRDGYVVRTTRKWLDELGAPSCPCGSEMVEA